MEKTTILIGFGWNPVQDATLIRSSHMCAYVRVLNCSPLKSIHSLNFCHLSNRGKIFDSENFPIYGMFDYVIAAEFQYWHHVLIISQHETAPNSQSPWQVALCVAATCTLVGENKPHKYWCIYFLLPRSLHIYQTFMTMFVIM